MTGFLKKVGGFFPRTPLPPRGGGVPALGFWPGKIFFRSGAEGAGAKNVGFFRKFSGWVEIGPGNPPPGGAFPVTGFFFGVGDWVFRGWPRPPPSPRGVLKTGMIQTSHATRLVKNVLLGSAFLCVLH